MNTQEITVMFPQPDYAVVCINGEPVKSLSAVPGVDRTTARAALAVEVKQFCEGLEYGFAHAIRTLQRTSLDMRTKL